MNFMLNSSCHFFAQATSQSKSLRSVEKVTLSGTLSKRFVLYANLLTFEVMSVSKSLIYIYTSTSSGPKTLPCGTPLSTGCHLELVPFKTTCCSRLDSQSLIHSRTFPSIPMVLSLTGGRWCGTLSKALEKSRKTQSTRSLLSIWVVTYYKYSSRLVKHDLPEQQSCCDSLITTWDSKWYANLPFMMDSRILHTTDVRLIVL